MFAARPKLDSEDSVPISQKRGGNMYAVPRLCPIIPFDVSSPMPIPQTNLSLTLQWPCFEEYHFQSDIPACHILLPQGGRS